MANGFSRLGCGRPSFILKLLLAAGTLGLIVTFLRTTNSPYLPKLPSWPSYGSPGNGPHAAKVQHPIEELIAQASERREKLLLQRSEDVATAATRYRERRGRHPPPGFDAWFSYAQEHDAMVIEELFDRAYHDLEPFWALDAHDLRNRSAPSNWPHVITVRNHTAALRHIGSDPMNRLGLWFPLIQELESYLPDVNVPMNIMDETRVLLPWSDVNNLIHTAAKSRIMSPAADVTTVYNSSLPPVELEIAGVDPQWITGPANDYWSIVRQACAPELYANHLPAINVEVDPPEMPTGHPVGSYAGFVSNMTLATDPCLHPHIRSLHGTFIESVSVKTTQSFVPLFGGSKLPMNNDILIPPAMYLSTDEFYAGGVDRGPPWANKTGSTVWRGVASGGRNKAETWTHFHRHRFVQMLNGSAVARAEQNNGTGESFAIPDAEAYGLAQLRATNTSLGDWVSSIADVAFTNLECFPVEPEGRQHLCSHTDPFFEVKERIPMSTQYHSKFLIDVDGNSFSGRFRAFLLSTSLPIKSTIYAEWHDSRLIPWAHYVPFDSSYVDLYAVLAFFLGKDDSVAALDANARGAEVEKRDKLAERIATEGKEWAEKTLRREDMALYFWRLLLEWARLCDDNRARLGWAEDLR